VRTQTENNAAHYTIRADEFDTRVVSRTLLRELDLKEYR
jgi:hypothetical protein